MKIVFMGTPDFAVPSLQALLQAGHEVCAVFTQADKPKGRGNELSMPPVKKLALANGLPVFQPKTLRDGSSTPLLQSLAPDVIVVIAYGKLLPADVLAVPKLGCVNVHGSLLPKYRGAAPIQWSVINGETRTGLTTMLLNEGMDTGDILLQQETDIGPEETAGELFDRLSAMSPEILLRTLQGLMQGSLTPRVQDHALATHTTQIEKEMALLDFSMTATQLKNRVRGFNPWPSAYTLFAGKRLKVHTAKVFAAVGQPGKAFTDAQGMLCVYCGADALQLCGVQYENGKAMSSADFLRGHKLNDENCLLG